MNKFVTRATPLTPRRGLQKRPPTTERAGNENVSSAVNVPETDKKADEPTVMEKLHMAIREDDAQFTFDVLSKNRPFDQAMNKTMTKIEFASTYSDNSSEFMLLSVDESVVTAFKEGQSLTIRGDSTDDAVLCTDVATFPIKMMESASTVLLMHDVLDTPDSPTIPNFEVKMVDGKSFSSGELCAAVDVLNIGRLKDMLREQELKWEWKENESEEKRKGYKMEELLDSVQMSVGEVKTALADLPVIKFPNGRFRYLSHKFRGEMLGLIVEMIDEDEIAEVSMESMSFSGLRANLPQNVPDEAIRWFLRSRCRTSSQEGVHSLPQENLLCDLAVVILQGPQKLPLQQFHDLLSKIIPFGVEVNDSVFEGTADIADAPFGKIISYLAPEDLPDTVKERMQSLFEHRKLWSMDQLRPYFVDLFKSKVAFDKFVVQNCDYTVSESNEMFYCGVRI
ncbi:unnamed protein product [Caenorhabditis sp. 36 PRJEB53466]|nr:unnamed protein product [Caenorhabditis sp. 36 PRJEB53466]